jgi:hypothetical protein
MESGSFSTATRAVAEKSAGAPIRKDGHHSVRRGPQRQGGDILLRDLRVAKGFLALLLLAVVVGGRLGAVGSELLFFLLQVLLGVGKEKFVLFAFDLGEDLRFADLQFRPLLFELQENDLSRIPAIPIEKTAS